MSNTKICGECGNSIPTWASQCPSCQRREKEGPRYNSGRGTSKRRSYSPALDKAEPTDEHRETYKAPKPQHYVTARKPSPQSLREEPENSTNIELRVEGLNRLLTEIYCPTIQPDKIISNSGKSEKHIRNLKDDNTKRTQLIDQIVTNLTTLIHTEFPTTNIEILNDWYGLNQPPHPTHTSLATHLQIDTHQIATTLKTYLHYLRQHKTRTQLEQHILQTATSLQERQS